jgi:hypothetical protein
MPQEHQSGEAPAEVTDHEAGRTRQARLTDALYQRDRVVARVSQPEIDMKAKEIRIAEVYNSDELLIPDECEFQTYRIQIQRVGYSSRIDKAEPHKGRILRNVSADILGYIEQ